MSYSLADGLSPKPKVTEIADFWEVECLRKVDNSVSILDVVKSKGIADDIQEDETEEHEMALEEEQINVIEEIHRRISSTARKYPFVLDDNDYVLTLNREVHENVFWTYLYLLLATRNNMLSNKTVANVDGTQVFEKLSRDVLKNYLGVNSKGLNFGTATQGGFYSKLTFLAKEMKEGNVRFPPTNITYNPQDDTLDVAAWIPFYDTLPSKIICFGQCKTGTHWHGTTKQLNVSDFLKKWFSQHPAVDPISTFIVADVLHVDDYYHRSVNNLFFDRCRIASFCQFNDDNDWLEDLIEWTKGIMSQFSLSRQ
jgi:hypothetical protein